MYVPGEIYYWTIITFNLCLIKLSLTIFILVPDKISNFLNLVFKNKIEIFSSKLKFLLKELRPGNALPLSGP